MGLANIADTVGAEIACITSGIFDVLVTLMDDAAELTDVGNGCVLGLPDLSRFVMADPVVIGGSVGVGKDCVPMDKTSFGFNAGATPDVGADATNENVK